MTVSTLAGFGASAEAANWCGWSSHPLISGRHPMEIHDGMPADLPGALCTIAVQSGEPITVRFAADNRSVIVWSRSLEQLQVAKRVLEPFPAQVITHVLYAGEPALDDGSTFVFDPPPPERSSGWLLPSGSSDISYAGTVADSQEVGRALAIGTLLAIAAVGGGLYWRSRIGLRAYAGIMALTVGVGVLLFSVIAETLGAGYPGFGRLQVAGLLGGLLILKAGAAALRGQGIRLRSTAGRIPKLDW